ncbi:MAG: 4Fe-4S binding protein [Candidatus Aminicenantes bacterium]|nr:4Fe-4S binding protein [Candidatus Aminicenantes bacterium]
MPKQGDVYKRLARHLDDLPAGFPPSKSGVELRILKKLFTEDEAEVALYLTLLPESPESVARRAGLSAAETAGKLEEMASKGLVYRLEDEKNGLRYSANQFVIGIWEFQVARLKPDLIRDMEEYLPTLMADSPWKTTPQLRTVPVMESLPVRHEIAAHENVEELLRGHDRFLVAPCICRRERAMVGRGCGKPEETCLVMGRAVDYYEKNGMGRVIGREEALAILRTAGEAGLVLQPSNAKKIANICMCCGCCCGVLRTIKSHPRPAEFVSSAFRASLNEETCSDCGTCLERCPMDALTRTDGGGIRLDPNRCIGCGLCVLTCPTGSLTLVRKPESEQRDVPTTLRKTYIDMARRRGGGKFFKLVRSWLRSAVRV